MANSMMFQRFPNHDGYDDPSFSSFYGQTLPLITDKILESNQQEGNFVIPFILQNSADSINASQKCSSAADLTDYKRIKSANRIRSHLLFSDHLRCLKDSERILVTFYHDKI